MLQRTYLIGLIFINLANYSSSYSQTTFERTYGGSGIDDGYSVIQTLDNGYFIAAASSSYNELIKTDSIGDTLWTQGFQNGIYKIISTYDSNYIALDLKNNLFKISPQGSIIWTSSLGVSGNIEEVIEDANGNIVAVGDQFFGGYYCCNPIMARVRKNGIQDSSFAPNLDCIAISGCFITDIDIDIDGNYLVSAASVANGPPYPTFMKLDTNGATVWNKKIYSKSAEISAIVQTPDTGFIAIARDWTMSSDSTNLIKLDKSGNISWTRDLNISNWIGSTIEPIDSGYLIAGRRTSLANDDINLVKIDSNYNFVWERIYGGAQDDIVTDLIISQDRSAAIVGSTSSYGNGGRDIYFIKTNKQGLVTALDEHSRNISKELILYPNPSNGEVCIDSHQSTVSVSISDLNGRLIGTLRNNLKCFELPEEQGLYLIRIETDLGEKINKKVIKN